MDTRCAETETGGLPAPRRARAALLLSFVLLVLSLGTGCGAAAARGFVPETGATATGPDGRYTAAEYSLGREGQPHADVHVWSQGAYREDAAGKATTVVHVGFSVENRGPTPVQLDERRMFLDDIAFADGMLYQVAPARLVGNGPVAAGATVRVEAYFHLPSRVWPGDVYGYRVTWALDGGERPSVEHTAFRSRSPRWLWRVGYYDPWSPWGWYYPWPGYPYYGAGYYWVVPRGYGSRVYGPRVLARPRLR